jgi:hypothetical protein
MAEKIYNIQILGINVKLKTIALFSTVLCYGIILEQREQINVLLSHLKEVRKTKKDYKKYKQIADKDKV